MKLMASFHVLSVNISGRGTGWHPPQAFLIFCGIGLEFLGVRPAPDGTVGFTVFRGTASFKSGEIFAGAPPEVPVAGAPSAGPVGSLQPRFKTSRTNVVTREACRLILRKPTLFIGTLESFWACSPANEGPLLRIVSLI